jgi:hypothetical protein
MIVQIVEMKVDGPCEHLDSGKCQQHRIVGDIDTDKVFWAYAESLVDDEWVADDGIVSYQRDSIRVPNLSHDPDVALYFYLQGYHIEWMANLPADKIGEILTALNKDEKDKAREYLEKLL